MYEAAVRRKSCARKWNETPPLQRMAAAFFCAVSHTGVTVVREHVSVVGVLRTCSSTQDFKDHRRERDSVRVVVLRDVAGNQPPASVQIHLPPLHLAHLTAALCREQHHEEDIVQRLRQSRLRCTVGVLRLQLMERRPELA